MNTLLTMNSVPQASGRGINPTRKSMRNSIRPSFLVQFHLTIKQHKLITMLCLPTRKPDTLCHGVNRVVTTASRPYDFTSPKEESSLPRIMLTLQLESMHNALEPDVHHFRWRPVGPGGTIHV